MSSDSGAAAPTPTASRGGTVVTIILCVVLLGYTALLSVDGFFIGFVSDSCSGSSCNFGMLGTAVIIGGLGPIVVGLVAIIIAIVRMVRRRSLTWLFPIAAGILATIILFAATALGYASVGLNFFSQA